MSCVGSWSSAATHPVQSNPASTIQSPDSRPDRRVRQLLENCLRQEEEVRYLTEKVVNLTKLDENNKGLVQALEEQVAALEKTIKLLKSVGQLDEKIEASCAASLKAANAEVSRWQEKASFWKKFAGIGIVTAAVVGAVVGFVMGSK